LKGWISNMGQGSGVNARRHYHPIGRQTRAVRARTRLLFPPGMAMKYQDKGRRPGRS
jgi:hypothetical protein